MDLCSSDDLFHLHEPKVAGERSIAEQSFGHTAPRLFNKSAAEIMQHETGDSLREYLKTFFFQLAYDVEGGCMTAVYILRLCF